MRLQNKCLSFRTYLLRLRKGDGGLRRAPTALLDAPGPGANGRIAAAIGVQDGQRIRSTRLALNRDEDAAPAGQRVEDAPVVRLKPHPAHRSGEAEFMNILCAAERGDEWSAPPSGTNAREIEPFGGRAERAIDKCRRLGAVLDQNRQRLDGKAGLFERFDAFVRPLDVLKHADRESL